MMLRAVAQHYEIRLRGCNMQPNAEASRVHESRTGKALWKKWGPYVSERQWGTVREDYSDTGCAWEYFSHDQARARAYHWGEDGLAGISDDRQYLCFALALWNGRDPILKERLFGLTNNEGNHGEDVKEYYFYLDNTPTHSYMKYLYKYPQSAYPYLDLIEKNRQRTRHDPEYELIDTGIFNEDRYFDVFVEYAKNSPEDILIQITICNRGPEDAAIHVLPTLWFRNTWVWTGGGRRPMLGDLTGYDGPRVIVASHAQLGKRYLYCEGEVPLLFTENETNTEQIFGTYNAQPYVKDGINQFIVDRETDTVNPQRVGTKASAIYELALHPGEEAKVLLRLTDRSPAEIDSPFGTKFMQIMQSRREEADAFFKDLTPASSTEDEARVIRQSLAGMLWSKQYYSFDVYTWMREHGVEPTGTGSHRVRSGEWFHMINDDIISMPDKWEYPWYAAWDLAFHTLALASVDIDYAKEQLELMLHPFYLHPSGQIPAYEWNFSDVNPPVHAWSTIYLFRTEQAFFGAGDLEFLKRSFRKLMLNFTWWVNRKDRFGRNIFEGGFLGLDNIGVFDRSARLPGGGYLEQADGTAWMALFCQNMLEISVELAADDRSYADLALKFVDHFVWIARALNQVGENGMWDEEDGFYYDVLRRPDGSSTRLKVRSMVGLLPLCATTIVESWQRERIPELQVLVTERLTRMPEILQSIHPTGLGHFGEAERGIFALVSPERLRRILSRMLDENEFLSPFGLRALSRYHADHPYTLITDGREFRVDYVPAESDTAVFGGNSNWRGPVWMPMNALVIRALLHYYLYYGDKFKVECPTGSGKWMNLFEVAQEIVRRLEAIFLRDPSGRRPVFGGAQKFQTDPHWKDNLLFYEYFHGDNGAGIGASHQTGWTGIIATLVRLFGSIDAATLLASGTRGGFEKDRQTADAHMQSRH
jgi:hypothetical protein